MELGMMVSETKLPPVPPVTAPVTVSVAVELTGPLNDVAEAVIKVVPGARAVTRPAAVTDATDGVDELHVTVLVTFWLDRWEPFPNVPIALNCEVWPTVTV